MQIIIAISTRDTKLRGATVVIVYLLAIVMVKLEFLNLVLDAPEKMLF